VDLVTRQVGLVVLVELMVVGLVVLAALGVAGVVVGLELNEAVRFS
jgi:hypothetical protein